MGQSVAEMRVASDAPIVREAARTAHRLLRRMDGRVVLGMAILAALAVGGVTGVLATVVAERTGRPSRLGAEVELRTLGALAWVLIGTAVVRAARWVPLRSRHWRSALAVHLGGALLAGFALNLILHAVWRLLGGRFLPGIGFWTGVALDALQNVHVNALVYAAIVGVVWWTDPQRVRIAEPAAGIARADDAPVVTSIDPDPEPRIPDPAPSYPSHLSVRRRGALVVIPVDDVDWVEGADDYACLHVGSRRYLSDDRLRALERTLDPGRFVRVHRSALVNLSRVREVVDQRWGDAVAVLHDGTRVRVSRTRRESLLGALRVG